MITKSTNVKDGFFSVLISVYHREVPSYLEQALSSIEDQTLKANEIVLVKDGPLTRELDDLIDRHCRTNKVPYKIVALEKNVGLGEALNRGLKECSSEWVARMDGDDISLPNRFQKQFDFLKENPEVGLLGCWIDEFEGKENNIISSRKPPHTHEKMIAFSKMANPFNHMTVVFKKEYIERVGSYKPMESLEDYYLWTRVMHSGVKCANVPEVLLLARTGHDMIIRRHGFGYMKNEISFSLAVFKIGYFGYWDVFRNFFYRALPRVLPKSFLKKLYFIARNFTEKKGV